MDLPLKLNTVNDIGKDKSAQTVETEVPSEEERDAQALARLGKKPVLKVC